MGKRLTIVTVNFNNAEGLSRTLKSICRENVKTERIELIVVDGGSSDGSLQVIREHESLIDLWVSEPDGGIFDAMNKGLKAATGEFINFMNSGDRFVSRILDQGLLEELDADICYGDLYLDRQGKLTYWSQPDQPDFFYMLKRTICHQSVFMRTALCARYPFHTELDLTGDWAQLFQIMRSEKPKVVHWPKPVCIYEEGGRSDREADLREKQRMEFLRQRYSEWEMMQLIQMGRLRGRSYYPWIVGSLDRVRGQRILQWMARLMQS